MSLDTYSVAGSISAAASATDVVTLSGSATTSVLVTKVRISLTIATAAAMGSVQLTKRSVKNTGGTSTPATNMAMDSMATKGSTAAVVSYSANPALGTGTVIRSERVLAPLAPATPATVEWVFDFAANQCPVLHGVNEALGITLNGFGANIVSLDYFIQWYET